MVVDRWTPYGGREEPAGPADTGWVWVALDSDKEGGGPLHYNSIHMIHKGDLRLAP